MTIRLKAERFSDSIIAAESVSTQINIMIGKEVGGMKKAALLCFALLCLASAAEAQYSNASLDGPWVLDIQGVEAYDYAVYLIFDGQESIIGIGIMNPPDSIGTYSVAPDGAISGYIWSDGYKPFTGQILNDSTAVFYSGPLEIPLLKVMDRGACSGCWQGQFVEDGTNETHDVLMAINPDGELEFCDGFAPPVAGRFYYQSELLAGHLSTGETSSGWNEIMFLDTHMDGDSVMAGTFGLDCTDCVGSLELRRVPCYTGSPVVPVMALRQNCPNPFNPSTVISFTLSEPAHVKLAIYDVTGRLVRILADGAFPQGAKTVEWNGRDGANAVLGSGIYFCRLQAGRNAITKKMVLLR
jgi:hypothetical protein